MWASRVLALALLVVVLWALGWFLNLVIFHWLAPEWNLFGFGVLLGLIVGCFAMARSQQQLYVHNNPEWPFVRITTPQERAERRDRRKAEWSRFIIWYGGFVLLLLIGLAYVAITKQPQ